MRADGRAINVRLRPGQLFICSTGCCCGRTEDGHAPVDTDLYHQEWERRRLRNRVHLTQGGCLGPCTLENVVLLLFAGREVWFHSVNDDRLVLAIIMGTLPEGDALVDLLLSLVRIPNLGAS